MSDADLSLEDERQRGMKNVARLAMIMTLPVSAAGWVIGRDEILVTIGSLLFAALALYCTRRTGPAPRILAAQALTGQAIMLNAAFMGHPLQIDSHMLYFALLATLVMMSSMRPVIFAAGTIAVHHLALTFAMPALVYPSSDLAFNIVRTAMHAVIVVMETAALLFAIHSRLKLHQSGEKKNAVLEDAMARASQAVAQAQDEKAAAEQARKDAEHAVKRAADLAAEADQARATARAADQERAQDQERAIAERAERNADLEHLLAVLRSKLDSLANGDLSARITEPLAAEFGDLRDNFNAATEELQDAMFAVHGQSGTIRQQSVEISVSATDLSARTERQAATLAEIAASLNQLTQTIQQVAQDSERAQSLADTTSSDAASGTAIMAKTVTAMAGIEESSKEIQKITGVIDDIAFQTNLLALNAGVEAARAGEAGRGFSVVASEVRALALRSSDAAQQINGLISSSVAQITDGVDLVNSTGTALEGIQSAIDKITSSMRSIARSTHEQSRGLNEANQAINDLESVTQMNAAMFEETTAANSILADGTQELNRLVERFTVGDGAQFDLGRKAS
ncbi:methyl-accepting chemotaxis protein [Aliiroseovarius sp. PTFE2010]|uniref:methyl-accepting chemotaxis protein n=1 Tax=Aliiroseovarius sp. PTFE2010 TaxID=3417190 RepID=UPI003CF27953